MPLGCQHYQRKVMFLTPCCQKEYICRRCHDANEKHPLNRRSVTTIICSMCRYPQAVSQYCIQCRLKFAEYFCAKCRMYDDANKGQFHCDKCDICRVGGRYNYFHCDVCNMCFNITIRQTHRTPCCQKGYICRRCHDTNEQHTLDRKSVTTIICISCKHRQGITQHCTKCHLKFAEYFCAKCRMYDDVYRGQFHCDKCDICRVGGQHNYFHCDICNGCFNVKIRQAHKCVENSSRDGCTICLEQIHTSTSSVLVPICGHLIHETCFNSLKRVNINACPTCRAELKMVR